jgi:hypothetical protein
MLRRAERIALGYESLLMMKVEVGWCSAGVVWQGQVELERREGS